MSRSIDEKVVSLRFNNQQFQEKVKDTLKRVEDLNNGLKFEGASKGLEEVNKEAQKLNFNKMGDAIDTVVTKIKIMASIGEAAIQRLTNAVIDFGKRTIDTFAIKPVTTGFQEYELKMGSVQTIMAATGASVQEVNKYLDELNEYSDRTIYSFADMTNNIGKFTNAGVKLEDAVAAIKGISNEAALSGATAQQASHAMYNFAQALASGSIKLIDWKSIETAQMSTESFRQELLNTAVELGTVAEVSEGTYKVLTKNGNGAAMKETITNTKNFNNSLSHQWLTTEVLIETLKRYSDEETEIGKKAYAAAQDVKTFSMMVDTLAEAAQSGWAATWQYVIGDFEEAKATWTEFTKFFDGIISASIEARNAIIGNAMMLQNTEGLSGREALWQSLLNILESVRDILGSVKKAWEDVFPPITDQKLRGIIESFHKFSEGLKLSDDRLQKIRATFRGIFAILDMFVLVIRYVIRVGEEAVLKMLRGLQTLFLAGFAVLYKWIKKIRDSKVESKGLTSSLDKIAEHAENFKARFQKIWETIAPFLMKVKELIGKAFSKIREQFENGNITVMGVILTAFALLLIGVISKLFSIPSLLVDAAMAIKKAIFGFVDIFSGIGEVISGMAADLKTKSIANIAKTLLMLVAALTVLTLLDQEKLYSSLGVMGILAAGLVGFSMALSHLNVGTLGLSAIYNITAIGGAVKNLAQALVTLQDLDESKIPSRLTVLLIIASSMLGIAKLLGSANKKYYGGIFSMIGFALSVKLLVGALQSLSEMNLSGIEKSLESLITIGITLGILGLTFKGVGAGAGAGILAMGLSIKLAVGSLAELTKYDKSQLNSAMSVIETLFGLFALLMTLSSLLSLIPRKFKKTGIVSITSSILMVSVALVAILAAFKLFSKLTQDEIKRASVIMIGVLGVFGLVVAVSSFAGQFASRAGSMILKMSIAISLLAGVLALLGSFKDQDSLDGAVNTLTHLMIVMGIVSAAMTIVSQFSGRYASRAGTLITKMSFAILLLAGTMAILSKLDDPNDIMRAMNSLTALMLVMGVIIGVTSLIPHNLTMTKTINAFNGLIISLAALVIAFGLIGDTKKAQESAIAIGLLLVSFGAVLTGLHFADYNLKSVALMMGATVALSTIIVVLSKLDLTDALQNAAGLGILLVSLSGAMFILGKTGEIDKTLIAKSFIFIGVIGALGIVTGLLNKFDLQTSITTAAGLGFLIAALSTSLMILSKANTFDISLIGKVGVMAAIMAALGGVLGLLEKNDIQVSLGNALILGVLLAEIIAAFKVLELSQGINPTVLVQIGLIAAAMMLLATVIGLLEKFDIQVSLGNALNLGILLVAIAGASSIAAIAGAAAPAALAGIGVIMAMITGIGLLMWGIGALVRNNPNIMEDIDLATKVLTKIGYGLGSLIGGIVGGVIGGIEYGVLTGLGEGLSNFSDSIEPFLDAMGQLDPQSLNNAKLLASTVLDFTKSEFIDGLTSWITGGHGIESFGKDLESLAEHLVSFSSTMQRFKSGKKIDSAIGVLSQLAEVASEIPGSGGLLQALIGNHNMEKFGTQLKYLGQGIHEFSNEISGGTYDDDSIANAATAITALAKASDAIPNTGGLLQALIGNNDMKNFGEQLPELGKGIKAFCSNIEGLDTTNVDSAVLTATKLAEFSKNIEASGGLWHSIFGGDKDMENFGAQLTWLGYDLWVYSTWINKITDFSKLNRSVNAIRVLADVAEIVDGVNAVNINLFSDAFIRFAESGLQDFINAVDKFDIQSVGTKFATKLTEEIRSTRIKFVSAGQWVVEGFISGVNFKMANGVKQKGTEMALTFLRALNEGLDINSPSKETEETGKNTVLGFTEGIDNWVSHISKSASEMVDKFKNTFQTDMTNSETEIKDSTEKSVTNGISEGLKSIKFNTLVPSKGLWENIQDLAQEGSDDLTEMFGGSGFWDVGAGIGDNLVNMKDALKEALGFGDDKDLSELFGFSSIIDDLEKELADSISDAGSGTDIYGATEKTASEIAEALKLAMHKHFDSSSFLYLGQQIADGMAIATNYAIVSESKAMSDTFNEAISVAANGIDAWKAWLEVRKAYDKVSTTEELAGWERIRELYLEGTQERMEADKEVYNLQKELVKGTFEYSKKWIDNEKYYERLSLEEELAAWERIQARYMEGSDERIEAEKELYRIRKEIRQKEYEDAKKWISTEKTYDRLSLADELAAYLRIQKTTEEGSEERLEMDEKIYSLQKEIYEAQQQYTEDVKAAQEEAAEQRIQLEEEYADKVREINERLASDIQELNDRYANEVEQRRKSLYSSYNLFDAVKEEDFDKDELMQNLEDQVRAFENWQMDINSLAAKGLDKGLIDELTEMGPSAAGQIRALNEMTDAELGQYNLLWSQKTSMAREQAISELEDLRVETSDNIAKLQQETASELDYYREVWAEAMTKITEDCDTKLEELRKNFGEKVGTIKKDTAAKMQEMVTVANQILREAGWDQTGEQIVTGILSGITKNKNLVITAVGGLATTIIGVLKSNLKINSPSKVTEEMGQYIGEGLVKGIESYYDKVWTSGNTLAEEIQNGALEGIKYINDLMQNGVDTTMTITPVFDMSNVRAGVNDMSSMLDTTRAMYMASSVNTSLDNSRDISFINPNENVVQELQSLRKDVSLLGEKVANMQLVMDTGAVVGQITGPLDSALGSRIIRNTRERG